jgi:hypothetical protein
MASLEFMLVVASIPTQCSSCIMELTQQCPFESRVWFISIYKPVIIFQDRTARAERCNALRYTYNIPLNAPRHNSRLVRGAYALLCRQTQPACLQYLDPSRISQPPDCATTDKPFTLGILLERNVRRRRRLTRSRRTCSLFARLAQR